MFQVHSRPVPVSSTSASGGATFRPSAVPAILLALTMGLASSVAAQMEPTTRRGPDSVAAQMEPTTRRGPDEGAGPFERLVIRGATMIDGTGAPPRGPVDIVVEGDRITEIRSVGFPGVPMSERSRPQGATHEIDAHGMNDFGIIRPGLKADLVVVAENPLENLKVLYGTGAVRLDDETGEVGRTRGILYTIKDGIVYDAKRLLADVGRMVRDQERGQNP